MRKIDLNNFQVATSETARDINSRIMLNLVRKHQPVSRADLMRYSGLQRSTVSVITEQLIAERWLKEGEVGNLPRGRKPTFLHLNEDRAGIFGINIQPCSTNLVLANLAGHFLVEETLPTPDDPDRFVTTIAKRIRELMKKHPRIAYEGIGVSLPGRVDPSSQRFVFAPNLGWRETNLKARLQDATGLTVEMENAANACALSEFWFGSHHEGVKNLIAVTVSEGIGVGMILNGQLVSGTSGLAGEFGHVSLNEVGPKCRCGNQGCWEVYASNSAALRYYAEAAGDKANNGGLAEMTFQKILEHADQGDAHAVQALSRMANYLGRGAAMLINGLAPEVIVFIGDVTRAWQRIGATAVEIAHQRSSTHATTKIVASDSAAQPRVRGIIALVLQRHFGAPTFA
ncbi:MAG TPA: ROK family protein [Verrucomicrobiae bacterium]|nr:ROK family protein [Verrucomicrobiae bacterium]